MRYYYLDSSALAKAYMLEPDSARVESILRSARADPPSARALVCNVTHTEVAAAITQALTESRITRARAANMYERLDADFTGPTRPYAIIQANDTITADAAGHARNHGLRGFDAIQLATALAARASTPAGVEFTFFTADDRLANAARTENFNVEQLRGSRPRKT